ncbi:uncharacterized protein SPSK_02068 [Sporothrix schenckii 1099-18]|uniref:Uncharacterized protein n=1 Tax=Sporothrix schenckii 1099-18 TaxID=1397361 RepID=A0A0F2MFW7_SPOSC|nr:uncharacterized protein SPSK_02068 [Sporothrix schenckii 1099-18]KJR87056.1 hypothetical protein SPSK_02068 [Sporothrix schenckii 1099-18]
MASCCRVPATRNTGVVIPIQVPAVADWWEHFPHTELADSPCTLNYGSRGNCGAFASVDLSPGKPPRQFTRHDLAAKQSNDQRQSKHILMDELGTARGGT